MDALVRLHQRYHPLCSSADFYCPSLRRSISSFILVPPTVPQSSSVRALSSPSPSSSDPPGQNFQYPETPIFQFASPFSKVSSFATITAAAALLFLGFHRNAVIGKPVTLSLAGAIQEAMVEESAIEELLEQKPFHFQSIRYLKLKEKLPIAHDFTKMKPDDQAWQVLKAQVFSCSEELELVKIGFEEILEKDPYCNKAYHERILEYLEMVDECKGLLKDIKVAMDRCERENGDIKYYLRFFDNLVARIKVLEGDMLGALKHFQELEQE